MVSGSSSNDKINIWNVHTDYRVQTIETHSNDTKSLLVLHSGNVVSGSSDGTIRIYKIWSNGYKLERSIENAHGSEILSLVAFPDSDFASGSADGTIKIWTINGDHKSTLSHGNHSLYKSLAVLPNGDLASGDCDHSIKIWNVRNGSVKYQIREHQGCVNSLVVFDDGLLASSSNDKTIKEWDENGRLVNMYSYHDEPVELLALLKNGDLLSASRKSTIIIKRKNELMASSNRIKLNLTGIESFDRSFAIFANGDFVCGKDGIIFIWRISSNSI